MIEIRRPIGADAHPATGARFRLLYGERRRRSRDVAGAIPDDLPAVAPTLSIVDRLAADPRVGHVLGVLFLVGVAFVVGVLFGRAI
jgi:hypothetical protein